VAIRKPTETLEEINLVGTLILDLDIVPLASRATEWSEKRSAQVNCVPWEQLFCQPLPFGVEFWSLLVTVDRPKEIKTK
jgi:hypothetical protein